MKVLKNNDLRLLFVGDEADSQKILNNIKKGLRLDVARRFITVAKALGFNIHETIILGLPGETPETIPEAIRFACAIEPETNQVPAFAPAP
jgi:radical SAM superfamily enzyme YgiQ (UPF0313 family)